MIFTTFILIASAATLFASSEVATPPKSQFLTREVRYDNEMLIRLPPTRAAIAATQRLDLDIWGHPSKRTGIDVRVSPAQLKRLKPLLGIDRNRFRVLNANIQKSIDAETVRLNEKLGKFVAPGDWFKEYRRYADIVTWCANLAKAYPNVVKHTASIGKSVEGRDIPMLKITAPGDAANRKRIWFQGLQHAREWISVMTVMYIADVLASGFPTNERVKTILEKVEVVLVPLANPDGYECTYLACFRCV